MNIGELARATKTKAETIRYYERIALMPAPPRTAGNYRDYSAVHVSRLIFTRRARALGFSIEQIRALLDLADQKGQSCEAVDAIARKHLADVKRKLADLTNGVAAGAGFTYRAMPPWHGGRVPHPRSPCPIEAPWAATLSLHGMRQSNTAERTDDDDE
jgi:DNA-binding transcriptional MerR regulator